MTDDAAVGGVTLSAMPPSSPTGMSKRAGRVLVACRDVQGNTSSTHLIEVQGLPRLRLDMDVEHILEAMGTWAEMLSTVGVSVLDGGLTVTITGFSTNIGLSLHADSGLLPEVMAVVTAVFRLVATSSDAFEEERPPATV